MNKKRLALILASLMAAVSVTGCANKPAESSKAPAESKGQSASKGDDKKDEVKETTLKYITVAPAASPEDLPEVMKVFNEQLQEVIPGMTVKADVWQTQDYPQLYETAMTAQEEIDVMWKSYGVSASEMLEQEVFTPLDEYMTDDLKAELPEWILQAGQIDGVQLYVPKLEMHHSVLSMQTDAELFEKYFDVEAAQAAVKESYEQPYRLPTEALYDVMEDYMLACKDAGEPCYFSPYMYGFQKETGLSMESFYLSCGPSMSIPTDDTVEFDKTVFNGPARETTEAFFAKMAEWKKMGLIRPGLEAMKNPREFDNTSAAEPSLIWFHNYVNVDDPHAESYKVEEKHSDGTPGWAEFPMTKPYFPGSAGDGMYIPYTCKQPEEAIKFIDLFNTKKGTEAKNTFCFGIEGTHYTHEEGSNRLQFLDVNGKEAAAPQETYKMAAWANGNVRTCYLTSETQPDNLYEAYEQMMDGAVTSQIMGLIFDISPVEVELSNLVALGKEYMPRFYAGDYTPEAYAEYLGKMDDAGIDKVIEEFQKQVDEFFANKDK